MAIYVVVDRPNTTYQDDAKFATRIVRNVLTEVLPYMNIYMTEELSESELEELKQLNIAVKKANIIEEEEETTEEETIEVETLEDGTIDARGGDTTSSTPISTEDMEDEDAVTAPLTGAVLEDEKNSGSENTPDETIQEEDSGQSEE